MDNNTLENKNIENNSGKYKTTGIIVAVVAILFVVVIGLEYVLLMSSAQKRADDAYLEGIVEGEKNGVVIEVDDNIVVTVKTLEEVIAPASELISYKYFYTTADIYEKNQQFFSVTIPFTTDKEVYVLSGVINVGIDLKNVDFDINEDNKTIIVHLPELVVMSHIIDTDSFKTYNLRNSVFTSSDLDDYSSFQEALKNMEEEKLMDNDQFWSLAKEQTKNIISSLINVSGIADEYTITYEWNQETGTF